MYFFLGVWERGGGEVVVGGKCCLCCDGWG